MSGGSVFEGMTGDISAALDARYLDGGSGAFAPIQTASFNAAANTYYPVDSTASVTVVLPAAPAFVGEEVAVQVVAGPATNSLLTNPVTVSGNGHVFKALGGSTTATLSQVSQGMVFTWTGSVWRVQDSISLTQMLAYSNGTYAQIGQGFTAATGMVAIAPSGDTSGATDTAAIQAALNALHNVYLQPGAFWTLNLQPVTGTWLGGAGISTSLNLPAGAASGDACLAAGTGYIFRKDASVTLTNGSNVVGDVAAIALDAGKPISATGFAANSFVGVVTVGVGFTVVNGSNAAVNFSGSTGSAYTINVGYGVGVQTVPNNWTLSDLTIDGNSGANSHGYGYRGYSYAFNWRNVRFQNCRQNAFYSEWGSGGLTAPADNMEAHLTNIFWHRCGTGGNASTLSNIPGDADGVCWNGPHDSQWTNVVGAVNGNSGGSVGNNVSVTGQGYGLNINNAHFWGGNSQAALYNEVTIYVNGAQLEGSQVAQWIVGAVGTSGVGIKCFAPGTGSTVGVQIGNSVRGNITGTKIQAIVASHTAGALAFYSGSSSAGGNNFDILAEQTSGTLVAGTYPATDEIHVIPTAGVGLTPVVQIPAVAATSAIQAFTANGSFTIPPLARVLKVQIVSGGAGGGSGATTASGTAVSGGAGGAGGQFVELELDAQAIITAGDTALTVTIGTGGAGGTAISANSTNGNRGTNGTDTTIVGATTATVYARASSANADNSTVLQGGAGGSAGASTGGTALISSTGGTGFGAAGAQGAVGGGANNAYSTGGGGAGGGVSVTPAFFGGGNSYVPRGRFDLFPGTTKYNGGSSTGQNGTKGTDAPSTAMPGPAFGTGGSGGAGSITVGGGTGGAGGLYGGGGGGGGSCLNGSTSGAGGAGAAGVARLATWF